ncbi:MAG: hypothetical protein LBU64_00805 [Planctomycetota bacterium]|jgi:hypothetical protein|nr:hypothetical protein [Planctomycetota bacterium]
MSASIIASSGAPVPAPPRQAIPPSRVPPTNHRSDHSVGGGFRHFRSRPLAVWREPYSPGQLNSRFETRVLPGLTAELERKFADWDVEKREEAVQDCVCLALETWRSLWPLGEASRKVAREMPSVLAAHASRRYLTGVRFAGTKPART